MILYGIVLVIGFIAGFLYFNSQPTLFETTITENLKLGKRVIVCIDNDATIFEMVGTKIRVSRGVTNFDDIPVDLDSGGNNQSH